ncbi:MAG: hypothetical protein ABSE69_14620 [Roseiarcus sp.]|jgi:hypothetical protein
MRVGIMLLPAGRLTHEIGQLGVAPFVLACATFGLAIWLAWLTFKVEVPLLALLAAAISIRLCGPIETSDAPFLVDGAFALMVTILTLLPMVEYAAPAVEPRAALFRGLLWGGIAGLGALSKANFGMFGVALAPPILLISFWRAGVRATLYKMAAAALMCAIPGLMFVRYGEMYLENGWRSAYGDLAQIYDDGLSTWESIRESVVSADYSFWIIFGGLLLVALIRGRRDVPRLALGLAIVAFAMAYLVLASISLNRQPRFVWPIWLILPIGAASAIAPSRDEPKPVARLFAVPLCAVAILWSLPMLSRFDLQMVREADALLRFLNTDHPIRLEIATDPPLFNINTLALAQQVDWETLRAIDIRAVVYDVFSGKTPEESEQQLQNSDFVLISWPLPSETPEASNRFVSGFLATAQACGRLVVNHPGPSDTLLFDMRDTSCKASGVNSEE